ncbi:MAG: selenoneine biosynthesis selenosugar synthase SenB [Planctomycetaceae bacterium]
MSRTSNFKIAIAAPQHAGANTGNAVTAQRWQQCLEASGHRVTIFASTETPPACDVLIALHAGHSANAVLNFNERYPKTPIVLGTVGTDLYTSIVNNSKSQRCLDVASRIVVLQPKAIDAIPKRHHSKCRVVYQSTTLPTKRSTALKGKFEVCVIGHLRPVKDPFRAAMAVRKLPDESKIHVVHFGAALSDSMQARAEKEATANPRYDWLGEVSHAKALSRLLRSRLLVHSSKTEGGANVITEAIMGGVPVLSSRILGSIGLLGDDYPGYFETGNTKQLRDLLLRVETDPTFLQSLSKAIKKQQPLFKPARERDAWKKIIAEVTEGKPSIRSSRAKAKLKPTAQEENGTAKDVKDALEPFINPEKAAFFPRFFKTGKGQYGEGDKFIGVTVPHQRKVAKQFRDLPEREIQKLLKDAIHEHRLTGVLILVGQYEKAKRDPRRQSQIVDFYLQNLDRVNNWDLVDSSAHKILGDWVRDKDRSILYELADSGHLWSERVSVIACLPLIKTGDFGDIVRLAKKFLTHDHDLMHKAVGWMLREMGNVDESTLHQFLKSHYHEMPRTMLRYAIEKLPKSIRRAYIEGRI